MKLIDLLKTLESLRDYSDCELTFEDIVSGNDLIKWNSRIEKIEIISNFESGRVVIQVSGSNS